MIYYALASRYVVMMFYFASPCTLSLRPLLCHHPSRRNCKHVNRATPLREQKTLKMQSSGRCPSRVEPHLQIFTQPAMCSLPGLGCFPIGCSMYPQPSSMLRVSSHPTTAPQTLLITMPLAVDSTPRILLTLIFP